MINIHEKIKLAAKANNSNFTKLEIELCGKRTGNLSNQIKNNKNVVPTLEKIFEVLGLDLVSRTELIELRKFKESVEGLVKQQ